VVARNVAASLGEGTARPYRRHDLGLVDDLGGLKADQAPSEHRCMRCSAAGYAPSMTNEARRTVIGAIRLTLIALGVGLLISLAAGLVVGLIIDDIGRGIGRAIAVGMSLTAVVTVALNLLWRRR